MKNELLDIRGRKRPPTKKAVLFWIFLKVVKLLNFIHEILAKIMRCLAYILN